jgi:hypothetical protein
MPPSLIFHIMHEAAPAQMHLQEHGLDHSDLLEGENVMLSSREGVPRPTLILMGLSGMRLCKKFEVTEHTFEFLK